MSDKNNSKQYYPGEWDVSLDNLKRLISGKGSLRAAFWGIWVIIPSVFLFFLNILIPILSNAITFKDIEELLEPYITLVIFLYEVLFSYRIVWMNTICRKKYWIPISRIVITISVIGNIYYLYNFMA